ncbi:hypothetical protein WMY93_028520 [Mugilogobius chulae]|uniref:Uncharacterized protein n=1 Tax=Mugilogobius chulae TaxID=88201 RepID=A0AAW0MUS7_9GOBI
MLLGTAGLTLTSEPVIDSPASPAVGIRYLELHCEECKLERADHLLTPPIPFTHTVTESHSPSLLISAAAPRPGLRTVFARQAGPNSDMDSTASIAAALPF